MRHIALSMLICLTAVLPAFGQEWAVGGFDPVGYAQAGRAIPGRSDIATMWKGQVWHFASDENRAQFEANPNSFAPALDGMCPISIIDGRPQPGDPQNFVMVSGHLYLLESARAERRLRQDPAAITAVASRLWQR